MSVQTERIRFPGSHGVELAARISRPLDSRPRGWALFAHCFTCSKDLRAVNRISQALNGAGIGVLRFDFTGLGESEGDFSTTDFSSNIEDLIVAADFMAQRGEVPSILIGHSLGGAAVLAAAKDIPSLRAVATIGAPFDPSHVKHLFEQSLEEIQATGHAEVQLAGRSFTVRREFVEDLDAQQQAEALRTLGCPLLVMHSPIDETVSVENARQIFDAARHPKSYISLDSADHLLTDPADAGYVGSVLASWSERYALDPRPADDDVAPLRSRDRITARTEAGSFRTDVLARHHHLVADEPVSVGGEDLGPTPYDLLGSALATCTTMTLRLYAERKGWPVEASVVRVRHSRDHGEDCSLPSENGVDTHMDHLDLQVEFEGDLTAEQRERLLEIAGRCPVHRTLDQGIRMRVMEKA